MTFESLIQIHADHDIAWTAFRTAIDDCKDIAAAISTRISDEEQRNAERLEELQDIITDDDRSETTRRMARLEVERLKGQVVKPTAEEIALYESELRNAETALRDVRRLQTDFKDVYAAAESKLKEFRKNVVGNPGMVGADNQVSSAQQTYSKLCKEAGIYE